MGHDDFLDDNPPELDTPDEIFAHLEDERGLDVVETHTQDKAQMAWYLMHTWDDKPPAERGGRTERDIALATEAVAADLHDEYGILVDDWPDIDDEAVPAWLEH